MRVKFLTNVLTDGIEYVADSVHDLPQMLADSFILSDWAEIPKPRQVFTEPPKLLKRKGAVGGPARS